jgi:DNA polymerase-3 subunit beta
MKFECVKERFTKALSKAERVSGKGTSNPILKSILLECVGSTLTLKATNLDLGIEVSLPVKMEEAGSVAVSAATLASFVTGLDKEKSFKFKKEDETLVVSSEHYSAALKLFPYEDFPLIPHIDSDKNFTINSKELIKGLQSVWYSASISTIKPELASVYIYHENGELVFVATDSFRLAEKKITVKTKPNFEQILIPVKNVADIIRVLEEKDETIEISLDKNQISFKGEDYYLVSRVVDASFPAYKQIIPKESKTEVIILKQDLLNALKVSRVFSDAFNRITFSVAPKDNKISIKTKNTDIGENLSTLSAALTGEDIEISFNYKNLFDCFQSINADSVALSFDGTHKALVIKGVGDTSFFYLVMPMNK